jgi:hypothetical protein
MAKYETTRKNLNTGDIVLFSEKGAISHGIKLFTFSKWSHVGIVLRLPDADTEKGTGEKGTIRTFIKTKLPGRARIKMTKIQP